MRITEKIMTSVHQSFFLVAFSVGIIVGTILALVFRINFFSSPLWVVAAFALLVLAFLRPWALFAVVALISGMVVAFYRSATELQGTDYVNSLTGHTVIVNGIIDGDPVSDDDSTTFKLSHLSFGEGNETPGSLYVSIKPTNQIARADRITLRGKLSDGFGTYSGFMYRPTIIRIERQEPGDLVLQFRNWYAERVATQIPMPEYTLGLSYLLGMRAGIPEALTKNIRAVGLAHIVVASGAHLSILVEIARKIFGKLSRFSGLFFSIFFVLFFMTMVGFTPSIMRAGIMTLIALTTWYVGRKIAPWRLILITAAITLLMNPMFIIDLGWLLSFASFAGIMIISPFITKFFYGSRRPGFIAGVVITTLSATVATLPITLYYFGNISLVLIAANLLILPTLPLAMGLTFITGATVGIPLLGDIVSFLTTKLLDFHIAVVNFFATAKSLLVTIEPHNPFVFLLYLTLLVPVIICPIRQFYPKMIKYH